MKRLYIVFVLLVCLVQSAVGAIYYVNTSGSDTAGDGSSSKPWRTLRHAVTRVAANQGHIIKLSSGTFVESGLIEVPLGVSIEGAGKAATILKAHSSFYYYPSSPSYATDKFLISLNGYNLAKGNQHLKDFTIHGEGKKLHAGIYVKNRTHVLIENVKVTEVNFTGIWLWDVKDSRITKTDLVNCSWGSNAYSVGALNLGNLERVEIDNCYIDEDTGYGIKAIGPSGYNNMRDVKIHHSTVTVNPVGLWNNGSAPNIAIELWMVDPINTEIYNCYIDNTVSLINANNNASTGKQTIRVHNNILDMNARAKGAGYAIELTMHDVEIDHNYINGGSWAIANWDNPMKNWEIHHNTFHGITGNYPGEIVRSQWSGLHNVNLYNNTIEFTGTRTVNLIGLYGGSSNNINVKNNLIINSNTSYSYYPNKFVHLENGASISNVTATHNFTSNFTIGGVPGNYSNNKSGDPMIQKSGNRPSPYYLPLAGSPLIDGGLNLGFDYQGNAPDIGAYEYGGTTAANNPPTVAITSPANNAAFTVGQSITMTANASDSDGTVAKVEFFNGTTKLGEDLTSPYSFAWNNLLEGTYSITAKATDNNGATKISSAVSIIVSAAAISNAAPSVSITSPANNAAFTVGQSVTITANASDSDGTVAKVEFFSGTTKRGEDLTSPYSFAWNNLLEGTHSITAKATDNNGATKTSASVSIIVSAAAISNMAPNVSITSPANNASFTLGQSVTITADASDIDGTVTKVEFFSGTTKLGEDLTRPYSFAWNNLLEGSYTLTAKATDNNGATKTSASVSITVNKSGTNKSPTVTITNPSNNASLSSGNTISIKADAFDSDGTVTKVEFYNGNTKMGEDDTDPFRFVWADIQSGTYALIARAIDNEGAQTDSEVVNVTVNGTSTTTNAAPVITITSPKDGATIKMNKKISIKVDASDSDGTVSKVEFFHGSKKLGEDTTKPYRLVWSTQVAGVYTITATATDNEGATASSHVTFTVNATLMARAQSDQKVILPIDSAILSVLVESGIENIAEYKWEQLSGPRTAKLTQLDDGQVRASELAKGVYTFGLTITDIDGSTISDMMKITVVDASDLMSGVTYPRYFSPNSDGINDFWALENIESLGDIKLTIFNSAGLKIYETESYQNDWDGTFNGKILESGAYYFVINSIKGTLNGAIRIIK